MKKLILSTGVLLLSGMTVMAQVTPTEDVEQNAEQAEEQVEQQADELEDATEELEYERLSDQPEDEYTEEEGYMDEDMDAMRFEGEEEIQMDALPIAIQDAFKGSEYGDWKVEKIHRVAGDAMNPDESYKVVVVSEDVQDEIEDATSDVAKEKEKAIEDGMEVSEKTVEVKVPALVLHYDKNGQLLSTSEENNENEE